MFCVRERPLEVRELYTDSLSTTDGTRLVSRLVVDLLKLEHLCKTLTPKMLIRICSHSFADSVQDLVFPHSNT